MNEPSLVPELLVENLEASLDFWCDLCGFSILYDRKEDGFAYLTLGNAHIMLEEKEVMRNWITAELELPYGRGMNLEITVDSIESIVACLNERNWPLFMEPEEKWYRKGNGEIGVRQFLVQDPNGYLLRFSEMLGERFE